MKKKEMKQLAQRIANAEINIEKGIDVEKSKELIMKLSTQIDWQDLDEIDEMIQKIISQSA